jgi:hypothetical protein
MAAPFDTRTGRTTGPPVPVLEGVSPGLSGAGKLAVSRNGWAVYVEASTRQRRLTMVDRRWYREPHRGRAAGVQRPAHLAERPGRRGDRAPPRGADSPATSGSSTSRARRVPA